MHKVKQIGNSWVCYDKDGSCWNCTREPFDNGLGKWFVELKVNESYDDIMKKRIENDKHRPQSLSQALQQNKRSYATTKA